MFMIDKIFIIVNVMFVLTFRGQSTPLHCQRSLINGGRVLGWGLGVRGGGVIAARLSKNISKVAITGV